MLWTDIQGQEEAVDYLRRSLKKGAPAHAYLFQGPEGVGKSLTARIMAQALNCERAKIDPCGECASCRRIERMVHPDVFLLAPLGRARTLTIDQIREMQKAAHLNARMGGWKIFILEDADTMQEAAGNSLLKTLEEPPPETMIILVTDRPERLLPTVLSRCQAVRFKPWPLTLMETFLRERAGLKPEEAKVIYYITGGRPGRAVRMIEEDFFTTRRVIIDTLKKRKPISGGELVTRVREWLELMKKRSKALESDLESKRTSWGKDLDRAQIAAWEKRDEAVLAAASRADQELIFELIFSWFRDIYIFRETGTVKYIINQDCKKIIEEQVKLWSPSRLIRILNWIDHGREAIVSRHAPPQLVFENLLLQLGLWRRPRDRTE